MYSICNEEEEEEEKRYCICNGTDDGTFMLACDSCDEWYHGRCVNIKQDEAENIDYICDKCKNKGKKQQQKEKINKKEINGLIVFIDNTDNSNEKEQIDDTEDMEDEEEEEEEENEYKEENDSVTVKKTKKRQLPSKVIILKYNYENNKRLILCFNKID